jgi:hypothetical protein
MIYLALVASVLHRHMNDSSAENSPESSVIIPPALLNTWIRMRNQTNGDMRITFLVIMAVLFVFEIFVAWLLSGLVFGYTSKSTMILTWILLDFTVLGLQVVFAAADRCVLFGLGEGGACSCCPLDEEESTSPSGDPRSCLCLTGCISMCWSWSHRGATTSVKVFKEYQRRRNKRNRPKMDDTFLPGDDKENPKNAERRMRAGEQSNTLDEVVTHVPSPLPASLITNT